MPFGHVGQLGEEQFQIVAVPAVHAAPSRREDAGGAAQDVDGQAGVVRERDEPGRLGQLTRLDEGVPGEGDGVLHGLGDIEAPRVKDPAGGHAGQEGGEDRPELFGLVSVPRR